MTAVVALLTVVVVALSVLVVGLLRSHAVIIKALHDAGVNLDPDHSGHPISSPVPLRANAEIDLRTADGVPGPAHVSGRRAVDITGPLAGGGARTVALAAGSRNGAKRPSTLLAFLSTGCGTCTTFWDAFADGVELPAGTRLVIVTKGPEHESPATVAAVAPRAGTTVMSSSAWDDFGVPVAPYFVLVDGASGVVVGEGAAHGWELVLDMLTRAVADGTAGGVPEPSEPVSRRDVLLGRNRHRGVDAELAAAGLEPGDRRLFHRSPYDQADR